MKSRSRTVRFGSSFGSSSSSLQFPSRFDRSLYNTDTFRSMELSTSKDPDNPLKDLIIDASDECNQVSTKSERVTLGHQQSGILGEHDQ